MKKVIKFPSIDQFKTVVSNINRQHNFVGLDENGEAIYDQTKPKPKIKFVGTVKGHGTHADVVYNKIDGMWCQSRENIISANGQDNAGFAFMAETNSQVFISLIEQLAIEYRIDLNENSIALPMEWAGGNIQKGVGLCNLPKSAFIFAHAKVAPFSDDEDTVNYWIPTIANGKNISSPEHRIYNVMDYQTFEIDVDFNYPQLSQNKIIEMTINVENECPISKAFGFEKTIGEGIVFHYLANAGELYMFKSKGELHSKSSKVTTLKPVDDVKINNIIETVNKVCVSWRLDQALTSACDLMNGGTIDRKHLGNYIRLVIADVIKEESDTIAEAGLEPKDVNSKISEVSRQYFFQRELDSIGL